MDPLNSDDDLFEWDGDKNNLPPKGKLFVYKNKVRYWNDCPCRCGRPAIFTENNAEDFALTIEVRGARDSGYPIIVFLAIIGAQEEEIIAACEGRVDYGKLAQLIKKYIAENPVQKGLLSTGEYLAMSKEITESIKEILRTINPKGQAATLSKLPPPPANNIEVTIPNGTGFCKN